MREFASDDSPEFSSFAELAGLTRSLDLALVSRQGLGLANSHAMCANLDASVTAWRSLLSPSKKEIARVDGSFDEILFKANMVIHTYTFHPRVTGRLLIGNRLDTSLRSIASCPH
jgi:hypothetical protein